MQYSRQGNGVKDIEGDLDVSVVFTNKGYVSFVQEALARRYPMPALKCGKKLDQILQVPNQFARPRPVPYHMGLDESFLYL